MTPTVRYQQSGKAHPPFWPGTIQVRLRNVLGNMKGSREASFTYLCIVSSWTEPPLLQGKFWSSAGTMVL